MFNTHINSIAHRAHCRSYAINKCFVSRDRSTLLCAFTTYVRPLLEYASPVWSTQSTGLIKTIESVARRFTATLPGCKHLTYTERLTLLHIDSLEKHRLKADLAFTYKIIFGLVNLHAFFTLRTNCKTRGHPYRLALANNKNTLRRNF